MSEDCFCTGAGCTECCFGPLAVKVDDSKEKVSVTLVIPAVKKPRLFGLFNKTHVQCHFESTSLRVFVRIDGNKTKHTPKYYLYTIRKLPASIIPSLCHYRIRTGRIKLTLRKAEPTSWHEIIENGLEKYENE
ncbi:Protein SGT1 [Trichinella spiralis]|uniref:Protein SGT1 n=1 Tax=Trichinella spiralis TaxID=6334 RepID=A0ABR3K109_TRISP